MDNYLKEIGERIRRVRTEKHLSQAQLAKILHVSPPYISNIEQGKQAMRITVLSGISDVLGVSADWLLKNKPNEIAEITIDKMTELLADCSPEEKEAILRIIKDVKTTLRHMMPTPTE